MATSSSTPAYQGANQPPIVGGWLGNWGSWLGCSTPAYRSPATGGHHGGGVGAGLMMVRGTELAPEMPVAMANGEVELVAQATTVCTSDVSAYGAGSIAIVIPRQT